MPEIRQQFTLSPVLADTPGVVNGPSAALPLIVEAIYAEVLTGITATDDTLIEAQLVPITSGSGFSFGAVLAGTKMVTGAARLLVDADDVRDLHDDLLPSGRLRWAIGWVKGSYTGIVVPRIRFTVVGRR